MSIGSKFTREKTKRPLYHRIVLAVLGLLIIISLLIAYRFYRFIFTPNVRTGSAESISILIPSGSDFEDVRNILYSRNLIINTRSFEWVASKKKYSSNIKPGHYILKGSMNNNFLVNMLRSGAQTPVNVVFNNIRTKEQLAGKISLQLEADSLSLVHCWNDGEFLKNLGFTPSTVTAMFIPNTYEMWWTSDAYEFTKRMHKEFRNFWEGSRTDKARLTGLSLQEVVILASIIEKETEKNDEKPMIAGVYLNRLRKGWPLQADPTLVFASGNFELKRVLNIHKEIDSPYNTYKYSGLPPGPICIPSISSVDAVLNYRKHDYMFFCAKSDLSGYHAFARTLAEHNRNATAYQKAISKMGI